MKFLPVEIALVGFEILPVEIELVGIENSVSRNNISGN